MKDSIRHLIQQALVRLTSEGVLPEGLTPAIQVENTKDKSHGDFASNIAMMLAKPAGMKPRELAEKLIAALPQDAQISKVEIAGPGSQLLSEQRRPGPAPRNRAGRCATCRAQGERQAACGDRPVLAEPGQGDACRAFALHHHRRCGGPGAGVPRRRGDPAEPRRRLGTQFGMLLAYLEEKPAAAESELADLEQFYRAAKQRFDESPEFADRARELVVKLQAGDAQCLSLWTRFNDISLSHCQKIYDRLNVKLTPADVKGESAYNADLADIVEPCARKAC